jgi:hypothetical protein
MVRMTGQVMIRARVEKNGQDDRRKNTQEDRENILLFFFFSFCYIGVDDYETVKMRGKKERL